MRSLGEFEVDRRLLGLLKRPKGERNGTATENDIFRPGVALGGPTLREIGNNGKDKEENRDYI